jgi:hypothetical protein
MGLAVQQIASPGELSAINTRIWLGCVVGTALIIVIGSGWFAFAIGDESNQLLVVPLGTWFVVGVLLLALISMLASGVAHGVNRLRKRSYEASQPGLSAFAWVSFQLACLLALLILGLAILASLVLGTEQWRQFLQALVLVLVNSALLFVIGASIRNIFRALSSLK